MLYLCCITLCLDVVFRAWFFNSIQNLDPLLNCSDCNGLENGDQGQEHPYLSSATTALLQDLSQHDLQESASRATQSDLLQDLSQHDLQESVSRDTHSDLLQDLSQHDLQDPASRDTQSDLMNKSNSLSELGLDDPNVSSHKNNDEQSQADSL